MKNYYESENPVLENTQILSLKVISLDTDGFATAIILEKQFNSKSVIIPFSRKNIKFNINDQLLAQIKFFDGIFEVTKIIKKLSFDKRTFFAQVNLNKEKQLILIEIEKANKKSEIIIPILSKEINIKDGDIVKAQYASAQILKKIKLKKLKANNKEKSRYRNQGNYAEIVEVIGSSINPKTFSYLAIKEYDLSYEFNENIVKEAKKLEHINVKSRKDLRSYSLVTIDGENAKDFDDAVFAEKLPNNNGWKIIVSIADVSHYVKVNSHLDKEASERGNSVYFPDLVVPMLPEKLSNNLCSLKPNVDRACLSVEIILDNKGIKQSHNFFRSIIKSKQRLTYEQVEKVIEKNYSKNALDLDILKVINSLHQVYKLLDKQRIKRGALNLNLPEKVIAFNQNGWPTDVKKVYGITSNKIIEELMILANVAAAEEINKFSKKSIYRVHEAPSEEKYKILIDLIGKPLSNILIGKVPHPSLMNKIIDQTKGTPEYEAINQSILRSQSQAKYDYHNKSHFGLALRNYVHFTSPIRRYSDLLIHRQIINIIDKKNVTTELISNISDIKALCEHISNKERRSIVAERKTIDRLIALLFQNRINEIIDCSIISLHKFGIFVSISDGIADALLPIKELPYDWYNYDEVLQIMSGERSGYFFKIGMSLKVKIREVEPIKGRISVKWVSGGTISKVKKRRRRKR